MPPKKSAATASSQERKEKIKALKSKTAARIGIGENSSPEASEDAKKSRPGSVEEGRRPETADGEGESEITATASPEGREEDIEEEEEDQHPLLKENSRYVQCFSQSPIDWIPWTEGMLPILAKSEKPVFIHIGFGSCHWSNKMLTETFFEDEVAEIINAEFRPIVIDRQERPELDKVFMRVVQAMGVSGGWPLNIFCTPDLKPFFGGTYFPKAHLIKLAKQLGKVWRQDRDQLVEVAEQLNRFMGDISSANIASFGSKTKMDEDTLKTFFQRCHLRFDQSNGGFGPAPKFPQVPKMRVLLRIFNRTGEEAPMKMVDKSLEGMARGGLYDIVRGGFCRYTTDARWLKPRFEKLLCENAQIATIYLETYQVTGRPMYATVAKATLDYMVDFLTDGANGGFFSGESADCEGVEGGHSVWTEDDLKDIFDDDEEANAFWQVMGLTSADESPSCLCLQPGYDWTVLENPVLASALEKVREVAAMRDHPEVDDMMITSWNGMAISAMALGFRVLEDMRYLETAQRTAEFIKENMTHEDGRLKSCGLEGVGHHEANLDDYAQMVHGLLQLYQSDFDPKWVEWAEELHMIMENLFGDDQHGGYFSTASTEEVVLMRMREFQDGALPNAHGVIIQNCLMLFGLTCKRDYHDAAKRIVEAAGDIPKKHPDSFSSLMIGVDMATDLCKQVAVIGDGLENSRTIVDAIIKEFYPNTVVAFASPEDEVKLPILDGREMVDGQCTAYVCKELQCRRPTMETHELKLRLDQKKAYKIAK